MSMILDIRNVTVRFGGVLALDNVSFEVNRGEFLCLIGPNGAGKTTMMRAVTGVIKPQTAQVLLAGKDISSLPTHKRARLGLALTHQIVRPFRSMTVLDNVALTAGHLRIARILTSMVKVDRSVERKQALQYLELVGIDEVAQKSMVGQPLGVTKRLEVARALALDPKVLLLDEPLAGLNSIEAARLADTVADINRELLGQQVEVLVEELHKGKWMGRTRNNKLVFFPQAQSSGEDWRGKRVDVEISWTGPWSMQGQLCT